MIKVFIYYLIASILCILGSHYLHLALVYLDMVYVYCNVLVAPLFKEIGLGLIVHQTVLLILIPCIITGIPAIFYRLIKKQAMPYPIQATWGVWLALLFSIVMIH